MLGFSQFKQAYEEVMEEWAQINESKISRGEFLKAIEGPWKKAFTAENIWKLFEVTGTWPVDQSKITPDKIAPAKGLAIQGMLKIIPTSPIKAMVTQLEDIGRLAVKPLPSLEILPPPLLNLTPPASPSSNIMVDIQEPTLDELLSTDLCTTRAAFLFDGSGSSSQTTVPPLELPSLPHFEPLPPPSTDSVQQPLINNPNLRSSRLSPPLSQTTANSYHTAMICNRTSSLFNHKLFCLPLRIMINRQSFVLRKRRDRLQGRKSIQGGRPLKLQEMLAWLLLRYKKGIGLLLP